jgi:hypothetical protein
MRLAYISHTLSTAARDKAASTSLRSGPEGAPVLDVLSSTPPRDPEGTPLRAPRIHGPLTRLATKKCEKCRLTMAIAASGVMLKPRGLKNWVRL